jgi:molecular chaperone DnaJ
MLLKVLRKMLSTQLINHVHLASGSGAAKGSKPIKCDYCSGRGKVRTNQVFLQFNKHVRSVVDMVRRLVNHAIPVVVTVKSKANENVTVKVPKGVDDGTRIRVSGKGEAGSKVALVEIFIYLFLSIIMKFLKDQKKIYIMNYPFHLLMQHWELLLKYLQLMVEKSKIKIPPGTQHGKQFRLKGKGMPVLRRNILGDLYIRIITQVPTSLSKRQKEILEEFNKIENNKPDPIIKNFFEKQRSSGKIPN